MATKEQLTELVRRGHEEILRLANDLSEEERSTSGTLENWAVRDILAHLGESIMRTAERTAAGLKGENPPVQGDTQTVNDTTFETYRERPWEDITGLLEQANNKMLSQLQVLSERDLNDPKRFPWLQGRPLWRNIVGTAYLHPVSHLSAVYIERGEQDYANRLRVQEMELVAALDDSPYWQGIVHYNMACHYALMGERQKALDELAPALQMNPRLIEWSQQDTDLVSLHEDAEFKALLARFKKAA